MPTPKNYPRLCLLLLCSLISNGCCMNENLCSFEESTCAAPSVYATQLQIDEPELDPCLDSGCEITPGPDLSDPQEPQFP